MARRTGALTHKVTAAGSEALQAGRRPAVTGPELALRHFLDRELCGSSHGPAAFLNASPGVWQAPLPLPSPLGPPSSGATALSSGLPAPCSSDGKGLAPSSTASRSQRLEDPVGEAAVSRRRLPRPVAARTPDPAVRGLAGEGRMQEPRKKLLWLRKRLLKGGWAKAGRDQRQEEDEEGETGTWGPGSYRLSTEATG